MKTEIYFSYVVTAYRWGQRNAHSYVVGAYPTKEEADKSAEQHVDYRGGKYACEVVKAGCWVDDIYEDVAQQVSYFESPYYGSAGDAGHFHPADIKKPPYPSRKPFTVRELHNELWSAQRELDKHKQKADLS